MKIKILVCIYTIYQLSFFLLLCSSFSAFSQEKKKKDDEFDIRNYKLEPADRLIIEINHTSWLGYPSTIKTKLPSVGMNIALMFDKPIGNSNFCFGYGIGFFSHNFHSNADFVYVKDTINNSFTTRLEPFTRAVSLNRYAEKILEIPIELRFRTKTDRQFKIHVGGKIGYVVNNFRSIRDNDGKIRLYDIKNVNPLRYGVNFRIGFEQFAISATYYLSEVFNKNKGPGDIHPFAIGLAIIPY
ncbi:MAG: PorT family protein [Bacteroidetes bacterium]|nr:PorT family protein [Bacteroidota bacterium]